jgi:hypothetical protein
MDSRSTLLVLQKDIPYYMVYVRCKQKDHDSVNKEKTLKTAITFQYYNKACIYSNDIWGKLTLYDILHYIKETINITDVDMDLYTLTSHTDFMWSIEIIRVRIYSIQRNSSNF